MWRMSTTSWRASGYRRRSQASTGVSRSPREETAAPAHPDRRRSPRPGPGGQLLRLLMPRTVRNRLLHLPVLGCHDASPTTSSLPGPRERVPGGCRQATADAFSITDDQPERSRPKRAPALHSLRERERPLGPSPSAPAGGCNRRRPLRRQPDADTPVRSTPAASLGPLALRSRATRSTIRAARPRRATRSRPWRRPDSVPASASEGEDLRAPPATRAARGFVPRAPWR